jgi:site-specific recombinase XerD
MPNIALKRDAPYRGGVALAEKPKRPLRIPVWLEREEQQRLEATIKDRRNLPINIFGNNQVRMTETRRRYELLFGLLLNSGLRISEALGLKGADVRLVDGTAKSVRVIGKGDKERLVAFGQVGVIQSDATGVLARPDRFLRLLFRSLANRPPTPGWPGSAEAPTSSRCDRVTTKHRGV